MRYTLTIEGAKASKVKPLDSGKLVDALVEAAFIGLHLPLNFKLTLSEVSDDGTSTPMMIRHNRPVWEGAPR